MAERLPVSEFPGFLNARDLGGHRAPGGMTRRGAVLRSEAPTRLDHDEQDGLLERGVAGFVDLRTEGECAAEPSPFSGHPGYRRVSVFDDVALRNDVRRLTDSDALLAYLVHDQAAGVAAALRAVLEQSRQGTVLVHCRAGKDRTGVLAALLLWNAGVADSDIARDHALSGPNIEPLYPLWAAQSAGHGSAELAVRAMRRFPPTAGSVLRTLARLRNRHGTAAGYLAWAGLSTAEVGGLRSVLL